MKEYDTWSNLEACYKASRLLLKLDSSSESNEIATEGLRAAMLLREEIFSMMDSFIACQADNEKLRELLHEFK